MSHLDTFLESFRRTRLAILIDDASASHHAALVAPAQDLTAAEMNQVIGITGGLPFVALSPERASAFLLPSMARPRVKSSSHESSTNSLLQYVSVEAREGISTGISAHDRALTVAILGASDPQPRKLVKPGHIFPVETREGGLLVKAALPEAALDAVTIAGFSDAALFLDLLDVSGGMMDEEAARALATSLNVPITTISSLIEYRLERELLVTRLAEARIPTDLAGEVQSVVYRSRIHDVEHIALVKGNVHEGGPVLVRVQAENTVADVFGGDSPPARRQLLASLKLIGERGRGVVLYLRRSLQDDGSGLPTPTNPVEGKPPRSTMMMREYGVGAQILRDLGVTQIELLSSSSRTMTGLSSFGIDIVSQHAIPEIV